MMLRVGGIYKSHGGYVWKCVAMARRGRVDFAVMNEIFTPRPGGHLLTGINFGINGIVGVHEYNIAKEVRQ